MEECKCGNRSLGIAPRTSAASLSSHCPIFFSPPSSLSVETKISNQYLIGDKGFVMSALLLAHLSAAPRGLTVVFGSSCSVFCVVEAQGKEAGARSIGLD